MPASRRGEHLEHARRGGVEALAIGDDEDQPLPRRALDDRFDDLALAALLQRAGDRPQAR